MAEGYFPMTSYFEPLPTRHRSAMTNKLSIKPHPWIKQLRFSFSIDKHSFSMSGNNDNSEKSEFNQFSAALFTTTTHSPLAA